MNNIDFDSLFPEKAKILMVDDTPANLDILRETLGPEGYNIYAAPRGDIAIRIAEQAIPDLILLDVMMPGMDGYETCTKLKESDVTEDIPVIFISAKNDAVDVVKGFEAGGVDYIFKPFKQAEVIARVKTHIRLRQAILKLAAMANNDPLTGLNNRRYLFDQLEKEIARSQRNDSPFAVVMADIDFFKQVNDNYGHDFGDLVLVEFSQLIIEEKRLQDIATRWGGEEFLLILPDTELDGAVQFAEKIRGKLEEKVFEREGKNVEVTASFGVALFEKEGDFEQTVRNADQNLYKAKDSGRNQVQPLIP